MEKSKKQYFNEINIMRGMAVLCVVIGHSFNPTEMPTILGFMKSFVYCFHMPAFFFISGFLEGEKRRSFSEKKQSEWWSLVSVCFVCYFYFWNLI